MDNRSRTAGVRRRGLFDRLAGHYDRFNHLTSLGVDAWWRRQAMKGLPTGERVLDLGCGGGQMARLLERNFPLRVGMDPSFPMLKSATRNGPGFHRIQGSGECLPFEDETFDHVVSGFVLRNLSDLKGTLNETRRVLRDGGRCTLLDFFPPRSRWLRSFFSLYLGRIVPRIYHWITGQGGDARWLNDSIRGFVNVDEFRRIMGEAGFVSVRSRRLVFGLAWVIDAERPYSGKEMESPEGGLR